MVRHAAEWCLAGPCTGTVLGGGALRCCPAPPPGCPGPHRCLHHKQDSQDSPDSAKDSVSEDHWDAIIVKLQQILVRPKSLRVRGAFRAKGKGGKGRDTLDKAPYQPFSLRTRGNIGWDLTTGQKDVTTGHNDVKTGHNDVKTGHYDVKTGHNDVKTGHYDVKTGHYDVKTGHYDVKTGHYDVKTGHYDVKMGHNDVKTGHYDVKTGHNDVKTGHYDVKTGHNDVKTGHYDVKTGHYDVKTGHNDVTTGHNDVTTGHYDVKTGHYDVKTGHYDVKTGHCDVKMGHNDVKTGHNDVKTGHKDVKTYQDMKTDSTQLTSTQIAGVETRRDECGVECGGDEGRTEDRTSPKLMFSKPDGAAPSFDLLRRVCAVCSCGAAAGSVTPLQELARRLYPSLYLTHLGLDYYWARALCHEGKVEESLGVLLHLFRHTHPQRHKKVRDVTQSVLYRIVEGEQEEEVAKAVDFVDSVAAELGQLNPALSLWTATFTSPTFRMQQVSEWLMKRHPKLAWSLGRRVEGLVERAAWRGIRTYCNGYST
ncbi:Protein 4.1 [Chionoecetes opilio]|uniref:Protein 4.1 n=1 Tax=Chionoecetes opilio TaxID=41210 RepID=A0A8J4YB29_CHIOP|nr:Protein 4.1 [Chionoecetes opilio]